MRAGEATTSRLNELLRLLQARPGRLEFALRLALIAALTTLVIQTYQTFLPSLAAYIVLFLNKPDRTTSLLLNVGALIAVSVLVALLFPLVIAVVDRPVWRLASMTAASLIILYLASSANAQEPGGILALILAFGLSLTGMIPVGEAATRALLYAWLLVATPAVVSIVVNLTLAPSPRRLIEKALAWRLNLSARMLTGTDTNGRRTFYDARDEGDEQIRQWLKLAALERSVPAVDLNALQHANESTTAVLASVDAIANQPDAALSIATRRQLGDTLIQMASILERGGYPIDVVLEPTDDTDSARTSNACAGLLELEKALATFAEPSAADTDTRDQPAPTDRQPAKSALDELISNPTHVRYAVKTTFAAIFCYLVYTLLDWPGIHTAMITVYIVSLGSTAETAQKVILRITGAVLGGILGMLAIVFLIPSMDSIMPLLALVFVGMLGASWIAVGDERISYAGFQIAFAFLLCVLQGWHPEYDLSIARDRVIGVLLGNVVVYLVFTGIWPVTIASRIDPAIGKVMRSLNGLLAGASRSVRLASLAQVQSGMGALKRDLDLLGFEPSSIRPPRPWVQTRASVARHIDTLQRLIFTTPPLDSARKQDVQQRLERLIASVESPGAVDRAHAESIPDAQPQNSTEASSRFPTGDALALQLGHIETMLVPADETAR
ncbi:FUSC family protein [Dokdonella sp.]|uniref:FUSC family protein n=1 Tax=Dokdonella sp. TaxID=2291710 RepID=UPI003C602D10